MAQVPFSQVVAILEAAGYLIHHRTKYPQQRDAYFYFFVHQDRIHPGIGFPVHSRMVQGRYYELILDALKGSNTDEDDEEQS